MNAFLVCSLLRVNPSIPACDLDHKVLGVEFWNNLGRQM